MNNALLIKDVGKRFGDTWVLRDVRVAVPKGKITAFMGPNGAGKTTLFHVISGALKPDIGHVYFEGVDITGWPSHAIALQGIGRQFQDVRVFKALTVLENVVVGLVPQQHQKAWWAWLQPIKTDRSMQKIRHEAEHWLDYVGLADARTQAAGELSFGQQKLLSLARLFAKDFSCLLLDEPTAGVSPAMIERIITLIRKRVDEGALSVTAFVEHNMNAVEHLADWIHFMHEGRIAFSGRSDHVLGCEIVRELYMGI